MSIDTIEVIAINIIIIAIITLNLEKRMVQIVLNVFSLINDNLNRLGVLKECRVFLFFLDVFIFLEILDMQI